MKKILFALSILALAVSCGNSGDDTPTTPKEPASKYQKYANENEIKIMSFNVRTKMSTDEGINHWDERKAACVALVKDHQPTIIGFQEAQYKSQWEYLKNQLAADYEAYGVNRSDGTESGSGEVVGIMWNPNVVKKIEVGTFWLSETPEKPSMSWGMSMKRTATWGLFEHIATGKEFFYINTHLPLSNDKYGETPKIEGMKIIANKFKEYKDNVDYLFLTGDLNVEASHDAIKEIKDFMRNARTYANRTDSYGTTNGFSDANKKSKIDHIYYSKEMKNPIEYQTIKDAYNGVTFVSDHYPIYSILKLK